MNTQYFHLPPTHIVKVEEPSARGLNMTSGENVKGQNYNNIVYPVVRYISVAPRAAQHGDD